MSTKYHTPKLKAAATGGITVKKPQSRAYPTISRAVTPRRFRRAFKSASTGNPAMLFEIIEFFKSVDDKMPGALQSLKAAILGSGLQITPQEDAGSQAQTQADVLSTVFDELDFEALASELLDSHFFGFSKPVNFTEQNWQTVSIDGRSYQVPVSYEVLPRDWIYADTENRSDDYNTLYVGDAPFYSYPDGSVIIMTADKLPSREDINFCRYGVGLGCIRYATFKYYDYEDWAAMLETFATPMILGRVGPGGQREVVKKAVSEMHNDARGVVGENDEISFPQANSSMSSDAYEKMIDSADRAIAGLIKSESLTDSKFDGGSYAAARTTNGIRVDVASVLARRLMRVLRRKIAQPIADLNWNGNLLVDMGFPVQGTEDELQKARAINEKLKALPGSAKHIRQTLNWPEPEDEDDTVSKRRSLGLGNV